MLFKERIQICAIDLNSAFRDQLNSSGSTGEHMLMGCVVNTFLSAYEAQQLYITVAGETLETGHVIYDSPSAIWNKENAPENQSQALFFTEW